jgi:hypothetical protein
MPLVSYLQQTAAVLKMYDEDIRKMQSCIPFLSFIYRKGQYLIPWYCGCHRPTVPDPDVQRVW